MSCVAQRVVPTPSPHFRTVIGVFPEQGQFALVRLGETPQLFLSVKGDSFRPCPVLNRVAHLTEALRLLSAGPIDASGTTYRMVL